MIQRIQSFYLLMVAVLAVIQFYFSLYAVQFLLSPYFICLPIIIACSIIISIVSIFLYKNRKLQIRLNYLNILLFVLNSGFFIGFTAYFIACFYLLEPIFYIPIINIILTLLAIRAIKKDENLVKSLDRIR